MTSIGKKRARWFGFLAAGWTPVSAGASLPFFEVHPESFGTLEWTCATLLGVHALLISLAIMHAIVESPGPITSLRRDRTCDPHKLY